MNFDTSRGIDFIVACSHKLKPANYMIDNSKYPSTQYTPIILKNPEEECISIQIRSIGKTHLEGLVSRLFSQQQKSYIRNE